MEIDYSKLSNEELINFYKISSLLVNESDTNQYVEKIKINSLYGAVAASTSIFANSDISNAITGFGRYNIKTMIKLIIEKINSMNNDFNVYLVQADTDSVVGDTIVKSSKFGNIKIEDLYNKYNGPIEIRGNDNFIKHIIDEDYSPSVSSDFKLENKRIKYIMKHKVKKRMFKIKCRNKEVIVTEDHSIMVKRNNELLSVKPKDILKTDLIINII